MATSLPGRGETPGFFGASVRVDGMSRLRWFAVLMLVLAVLGACGDDGGASGSDQPAAEAGGECEEGAVTTESGLKYEEIECGEGEEAGRGDTVSVKYRGALEDGTEFDSGTYPFQIGAGMVIPGWEEGIAGMKVGGQRKLTIPPDLAYGSQGRPPVIPPNATLIFDVELLEIQQPQ